MKELKDPTAKPDNEPVKVFDTQQESEAMVVHGLLASAGIDSVVTNLGIDQALWPGGGGVVVMVSPGRAEDARRMIEEYSSKSAQVEDLDDEAKAGD